MCRYCAYSLKTKHPVLDSANLEPPEPIICPQILIRPGKNVYDKLGGSVPIGLVSDNWGGTRVEQWTTPESTAHCGHQSSGELYNAMIVPYSVGPMAVSGARPLPAPLILDTHLRCRIVVLYS